MDERFFKADLALARAVEVVVNRSNESLKYDFQVQQSKVFRETGRSLRGRQMVWLVLDFFRTNRSLKTVYAYEDMENIKWLGDNRLEEFYRNYCEILNGLSDHVTEEALTEKLLRILRKSTKLLTDIQWFERLPEGDPQRTHVTLRSFIEGQIRRDREQANRENQKRNLGSGATPNTTPLAAATENPKGKGRGKGRGRKGQDPSQESVASGEKGAGKSKAPCFNFLKGNCTRSNCPYAHISEKQQAQLRDVLGKATGNAGNQAKRDESARNSGAGKHRQGTSAGSGRGRSRERRESKGRTGSKGSKGSKGSQSGKKNTRRPATPVRSDSSVEKALRKELSSVRSNRWCTSHLKGKCNRGDGCTLPHLEQHNIDEIKRAAAAKKAAAPPKAKASQPTK